MKPQPNRAAPAASGTTVEYQVRFSVGPKGRKRVRAVDEAALIAKTVPAPPRPRPTAPVAPSPRPATSVAPPPGTVTVPAPQVPSPAAPLTRIPKITLLLVLGHHFERLVLDGIVKDYAEIARRTGLSRARVTQIVNLTLLAPEIQESVLMRCPPNLESICERTLRAINNESEWVLQQAGWENLHGGT